MKNFHIYGETRDSPKFGKENKRINWKGKLDVQRITDALQGEGIDVVISSPYNRSILTVQQLAKQIGQEVLVFEDLKERILLLKRNEFRIKNYSLW